MINMLALLIKACGRHTHTKKAEKCTKQLLDKNHRTSFGVRKGNTKFQASAGGGWGGWGEKITPAFSQIPTDTFSETKESGKKSNCYRYSVQIPFVK